jgi:hypothetical protein
MHNGSLGVFKVARSGQEGRAIMPSPRPIKLRHPRSFPEKSPTLSSIIKPSVTVVRLRSRRQFVANVPRCDCVQRRQAHPMAKWTARSFAAKDCTRVCTAVVRGVFVILCQELAHVVIAPTMLDRLRNSSRMDLPHCFEQGHDSNECTPPSLFAGAIGCASSAVCFEAQRADMNAPGDLPNLQP